MREMLVPLTLGWVKYQVKKKYESVFKASSQPRLRAEGRSIVMYAVADDEAGAHSSLLRLRGQKPGSTA
jgi:hypothetical protein